MPTDDPTELEILRQLKLTDAPQWLAPNPSLSQQVRTASLGLFSSLKPYAPQSPLDQLLIDRFDAEQIWQQIELQSQSLLSGLKMEVRRFEKNPREISRNLSEKPERRDIQRGVKDGEGRQEGGVDGSDEDEANASEEQEEEEEEDNDGGDEEEEQEDGDEDESESGDEGGKGGIEDGFLKIKELEGKWGDLRRGRKEGAVYVPSVTLLEVA